MKLTLFVASMLGVVLLGSMILIVGVIDLYIRTTYPEERKRSIIYRYFGGDLPLMTGAYGVSAIIFQIATFF